LKRSLFVLCAILLLLVVIPSHAANAAETKPADILKKKYPKEVITIIKSADLDNNKKNENFILTETGNFYFINDKGVLRLISTGITSHEEFDPPTIQVFSVTKTEKQVAIAYNFPPANTQMEVYRLKYGTLNKVLDVMGDRGVSIDKQGRVIQHWKKYYPEGGWEPVAAVYTWVPSKQIYKGSGQLP